MTIWDQRVIFPTHFLDQLRGKFRKDSTPTPVPITLNHNPNPTPLLAEHISGTDAAVGDGVEEEDIDGAPLIMIDREKEAVVQIERGGDEDYEDIDGEPIVYEGEEDIDGEPIEDDLTAVVIESTLNPIVFATLRQHLKVDDPLLQEIGKKAERYRSALWITRTSAGLDERDIAEKVKEFCLNLLQEELDRRKPQEFPAKEEEMAISADSVSEADMGKGKNVISEKAEVEEEEAEEEMDLFAE